MYVNKCIKCGAEFETKNPKRVICPNCLYADKGEAQEEKPMQSYSSYSTEQRPARSYDRPQGGYRNNNCIFSGQTYFSCFRKNFKIIVYIFFSFAITYKKYLFLWN